MNDVLARICDQRRADVAEASSTRPLSDLRRLAAGLPPVRSLSGRIGAIRAAGARAFIAEIKRASPSRGVINADVDPADRAARYAAAGVAGISVLTEPHEFLGTDEDLRAARLAAATVPILRKDFTVDPWQIWEARVLGADAVLLLVNVLGEKVAEYLAVAAEAGVEALVETHDAAELDLALRAGATLIGVNARNLRTFATDLGIVESLIGRIPAGRIAVAESGIRGRDDVDRLAEAGAGAFLVGETLMREADPGRLLHEWGAPGGRHDG
jgi:indole-3-glycerol phosphate synthase